MGARTANDNGDLATGLALLESAFARSPIGVALTCEDDGRTLFVNPAMRAHRLREREIEGSRAAGGVHCDPVHFCFEGRRFALATAVDVLPDVQDDTLARRAFYDDLTGLPKTQLVQAAVDAMIADDAPAFAVAFVDLDNFKFINDCYGHDVGDRLLVKVCDRMAETIRDTDILARVGGDEFVVVLSPMPAAQAIEAAQRLSARIREPFSIDGFEIFTSASIGLSLHPFDGADYATLRAKADTAMYGCKANGKGEVRIFDVSMSQAATRRMESEQRLRLALRDGRIGCAYQKKVDFRTDTVVGVEVLLRWRDENDVLHPPGDFIRLAIELGLLDEITMTIFERVVEEIDLIDDAFGPAATISLNVAASQAANIGFMRRLEATIRAAGLSNRMMLELTEEALLAADAFKTSVLPMLREAGLRISIDDFGAGYSSLSTLAELAADELKIDRSFITDIHRKPRNQAIVKVIDSLAATLGMRVVVEGVETHEELAYLMSATRIACAQGYYFARPVSLGQVARPAKRASPLRQERLARR